MPALERLDGYVVSGQPIVAAFPGWVYGNGGWFRERIVQPNMSGGAVLPFLGVDAPMSTKTAILSVADLKPDNLPTLRQALQALPGVSSVDFNLERSVAVLEFDPSQSHIDDFLRAVLKAGFKVL